jgi:hypothetical protein
MSNETTALEVVIEPPREEISEISLSDEERTEFQERTQRILEAFHAIHFKSLEIWRDLKEIKDRKLYREKYETFNIYCRDELSKDNSQIYRYLKDAEFKETLLLQANDDAERSSIMNLKEANTRFLRTLPDDVQVPFWRLSYGIGLSVLPKKEDGSIEPTTGFLESVGERVDEVMNEGGIHLNGEFIPLDRLAHAAEVAGTDEITAKTILLTMGVSEEYFELLKRQEQHIKERSMKSDTTSLKGTVEVRVDSNGSDYPVMIDSKGNEIDLAGVLLAFNNRWVSFSLKAPIRD